MRESERGIDGHMLSLQDLAAPFHTLRRASYRNNRSENIKEVS